MPKDAPAGEGAAPLADATVMPYGLDVLSRDERFELSIYQGFLAGVKTYWRGDLYAKVKGKAEAIGGNDPEAIERKMQGDPDYFLYSWLERRGQQFKYGGRGGLQTLATKHAAEFAARLPPPDTSAKAISTVPGYVSDFDVHQHPKGLWSDMANAVAHEWYQTGHSFSGVGTDAMVDTYVGAIVDHMPPDGRVLDLGCTLGRMSTALRQAAPGATIVGADVSEPVIRLARVKAAQRGLDIAFHQENSEDLPFEDVSFDVVASHWLFHELPKAAIGRTLDETARLLKPGGWTVIFDMYHVPGGTIGQWFHAGYGVRNNEPFGEGYVHYDLRSALARRGFTDIEMSNFDPEIGGLRWVEDLPAKRTHYNTVVVARKA